MHSYREDVRWPLWFHVVMAFPVGIALGVIVTNLGPDPALLVPGGLVLVIGYVWWRLRYLAIEAGPGGIAFGFGGLHRRVPRDRLLEASPEDYRFWHFMGWGYRFGRQPRERAYSLIGYRSGLRVVFRDERDRVWSVFLSCSDPEAVAKAIS